MSAEVEIANVRTKDRKADVSIKRFFRVIGKSDVDQPLNINFNQVDSQKNINVDIQTEVKALTSLSTNGTLVDNCKSDSEPITRSSNGSVLVESECKENFKAGKETIQTTLQNAKSMQTEVNQKVSDSVDCESAEKLAEAIKSHKAEVNVSTLECDRSAVGGVQETVESGVESNEDELVLLSYAEFLKEKQLSNDEGKETESVVPLEKQSSITNYFSSTRLSTLESVETTNGSNSVHKPARCRKGRSRSDASRGKKGILADEDLPNVSEASEKCVRQRKTCAAKRKTTPNASEYVESDRVKRPQKRTKRSSKEKPLVGRSAFPELRRSPRLEKLPAVQRLQKPETNQGRACRVLKRVQKRACKSGDEFLEGSVLMQDTSYKVAVISEKGGKKCIRLRITRLQKEESKAVVKKAQRILSKAKKASSVGKDPVIAQPPKTNSAVSVKKPEKKFEMKYPLAPLFLPSKTRSKKRLQPKMDAATLEKRKRFLSSGIPEKLQRKISLAEAREALTEHLFPTIGHIGHCSTAEANSAMLPLIVNLPNEPELQTYFRGRMLSCGMLTYTGEAMVPWNSKADKVNVVAKPEYSRIDCILNYIQEKHEQVDVRAIYDMYVQKREKADIGNLFTEIGDTIATDADPFEFDQISDEDDNVPICALIKRTKSNGLDQQTSTFKPATQKLNNFIKDEVSENGAEKKVCSAPWTMVYQPESLAEVVGNKACGVELRSWLSRWKTSSTKTQKKEQPVSKSRKRKRNGYTVGDSDYDSDSSSESESSCCNTVLLMGPSGCGKTATVYAIAKELGYKILEVNANSRRSGRLVLDKLREATQSHQVNDRKSVELSPSKPKLLSVSKNKKSKRLFENVLAETELCESLRDGSNLSLILFDDVDIVFLEDDGFWGAVNSFMCSAKRPIILTTSDTKFVDRGRIKEKYIPITFTHPELSTQALHLQLLCLTQGLFVQYEDLLQFVEVLGGNFRACLLTLEFWSHSEMAPLKDIVRNCLDENLLMGQSFAELSKLFGTEKNAQIKYDMLTRLRTFHEDLLHCSWPCVLSGLDSSCNQKRICDDTKKTSSSPKMIRGKNSDFAASASPLTPSVLHRPLRAVLGTLENLSCLDLASASAHCRVTDDIDILLGLEDGSVWDDTGDLTASPLTTAIEEHLHYAMFSSFFSEFPNASAVQYDQLWKIPSAKQFIEKNSAVLSALPLGSQLNKRAFYLDYLPCIRNISRTEQERKTSGSNKRGGRFSHYLCSNALYLQPCTVTQLCEEFKTPP